MSSFLSIIFEAIRLGATLLLGATGEIITEKSGHLNLGTPGIMSIGGISGIVGAYYYSQSSIPFNPWLAVLFTLIPAILGSLLASLLYSFFTISLKANQNVTGLTLTTFGLGISNFIGSVINDKLSQLHSDTGGIAAFPDFGTVYQKGLPFAGKLGAFGNTFLSFGFMTYAAIIIAVLTHYVIFHTRVGMNLRAIGENPATADAAGIKVTRYKYLALCIGGVISGLGGLQFVMECNKGNWSNSMVEPYGWLAVAIVIFAIWKPNLAIFGSILFGGLLIFIQFLPNIGNQTKELLRIVPYVVTIIVLVITSMINKRENQPPAHLGLPYFREDR